MVRKGFTMIEMLIVLAVIAALMSVITPTAINAIKSAKGTQIALNMRTALIVAQEYLMTEQKSEVPATFLENTRFFSSKMDMAKYHLSSTDSSGKITVTVTADAQGVSNYVIKAWSQATGDNTAGVSAQTMIQRFW